MISNTKLILGLLFVAVASADSGVFYYNVSGSDWNGTCATGKKQSPINFALSAFNLTGYKAPQNTTGTAYQGGSGSPKAFQAIQGLRFDLDYEEIDTDVENLTNSVFISLANVSGHFNLWDETQKEKDYKPLQFHFHSPSEHTVDGKNYDLEMHIVNTNSDSTALSVLGVFFDLKVGGTTESAFLKGLITAQNNTNTTGKVEWAPSAMLLETFVAGLNKTRLLNYEGSLTTPGCSEIVEWNVLVDPQPLSTAQLAFFQNKWSNNNTFAKGRGNNRLTQAIGDRTIYYYGGEAASAAGSLVYMISSIMLAVFAIFI